MENLTLEKKSVTRSGQYLPEHILHEIRLRLPAKSAAKFRCVSKSWLSSACMHRGSIIIQSVSEQNGSNRTVPLLFTAENSLSTAVVRHTLSLPEVLSSRCTELLASCDGLIFLRASGLLYYVLNPLTGQSASIPAPLFREECTKSTFGFYFNRWTGKYSLFSIVGMPKGLPRTSEVFSFGSNSWRKLHSFPPVNYVDLRHNPLNVKDFLYSMAYKNSPSEHPIILAFNIRYEMFTVMQSPPYWEDGDSALREENTFVGVGLVDIDSKLGFYATSRDENCMDLMKIIVWIVDDFEIKGWSKFCSVSCRQGSLLGPINYWRTTALYQSNGELLILFDSHDTAFVVVCNMKFENFCAVGQSITDLMSLYYPTLIYRESLTSLDSCCHKHLDLPEMITDRKRKRLTISEWEEM